MMQRLREFLASERAKETAKPPPPLKVGPPTDSDRGTTVFLSPPLAAKGAPKGAAAVDDRVGTTVYTSPPLDTYKEPDFGAEAISALAKEEQAAAELPRSNPRPLRTDLPPPPPTLPRSFPLPPSFGLSAAASSPPPPVSSIPIPTPPVALSSALGSPESALLSRTQASHTVYFQIPPVAANPEDLRPALLGSDSVPLPKPGSPPVSLSASHDSTSNRSGTVVYATPPVSDSDDRGTVMFSHPPDLGSEGEGSALSSMLDLLGPSNDLPSSSSAEPIPVPPPRTDIIRPRTNAVDHTALGLDSTEASLYVRIKMELQAEMALQQEIMREEMRLEVEGRLSEFIKLLYQEIGARERKNRVLEAEIAALKAKAHEGK